MNFEPTQEQLNCVTHAVETMDNILVQALAGAAKTATIVLMSKALPDVEILCLAFNKKIAVEMNDRLPSNCRSSTLNALGHRIWGDAIGKRLNINTKKMYTITSDVINALPSAAQESAWKGFKEILSTVKEAKSAGYIPEEVLETRKKNRPNPLMDSFEFYEICEFKLADWEQNLVDAILCNSIEQSFDGEMDFDDQIYMPSCFRAAFPIYSLVMVDEAQDLSALNHRFLKRLARKRLIAVGDPCQAIYGFRGAHEHSMQLMRDEFNMKKLTLTTSFRCPEAIVEHVRWRAPEMQSWDDHPALGEIDIHTHWAIDDIPDNAVVICRNNAPLYKLAITFLKNGRPPKLAASDIGKALVGLMKKLGPTNMLRDDAKTEVKRWLQGKEKRSRAKRTFRDQAECMNIFLDNTDTLGQAIHFAQSMLSYEGAVQFMTGHKAKGLEFEQVYFLDEELVKHEGQDRNLRYVICTRATRKLSYVNSEDCAEIIEANLEEAE